MNNSRSNFIKYPYSALSLNNADYDSYLLFKNWCSISKKSGFLKKGELQSISRTTGIHINKLYRLLSKFKELKWVEKNGNGYRLLSINTVNNNNLNLKSKEHLREGFEYYPFFKISKENINHLEQIKMHHLIYQTAKRYTHHLPKANKLNADSRKRKNAQDKGFTVSLSKLKEKGCYDYNSTVDNIITKAEKLGLLTRNKNGFNEKTNKYNCNDYILSNYAWYEPLTVDNSVNKPIVKNVKTTTIKKKTVWNSSELKFKSFVNDYLVELVDSKYLDKKYYTRTLSKRSYPKLLKSIFLSKNNDLKSLLFGYINQTDISITYKLIESNWWTLNKINKLPKEYYDKEYGIDYKFNLIESETTIEQLTKTINLIKSAKDNYYSTKGYDYNHHNNNPMTFEQLKSDVFKNLNKVMTTEKTKTELDLILDQFILEQQIKNNAVICI